MTQQRRKKVSIEGGKSILAADLQGEKSNFAEKSQTTENINEEDGRYRGGSQVTPRK